MRKRLWFFCIGVALLAGCATQPTVSDVGNGVVKKDLWTIKIGVIIPLSWPGASYGQDALHGYQYIVDTVNAAGGIDGRQIELIVEDGKCSGKDATAAVQKLINIDKLAVIAGGACSSETLAAGKIAQEQGVVMVSALSSSPDISQVGDYIFRYWNDLDAGKTMLNYLQKQNTKTIGIIYENTDYASAYASVIRKWFAGAIVLDQKYQSDEKDFSLLAKKIEDYVNQLDALVYIPQTPDTAIPFIKALSDEWLWETLRLKILWTETVSTEQAIATLWSLMDGVTTVKFAGLDELGQTARDFSQPFLDDYQVLSADIFVALSAESMQLIIDSIKAAGYDSAGIKSYLASITQKKPRSTFFGPLYFNELGDGQGIPFSVARVVDGVVVTIPQ